MANPSPDLHNVFTNAGHLLGLIAVGLERGRGWVRLEFDLKKEAAYFDWEMQGFVTLRNRFEVTFSVLDRADTAWLMDHAKAATHKWNNYSGDRPW